MKILSAVDTGLRHFANVKHSGLWPGLCPAPKIRGGKVLPARTKRSGTRARQGLKLVAMSPAHIGPALGAICRRLFARMYKPRANMSTAHKLARIVYFMLVRSQAFVGAGPQRYEEQHPQRSIAAFGRRAGALSSQVNPVVAVA